MQLELFQHTRPAQRPLPADWRPCDLGWVRFGVAIADFDRALAALAGNGIAPLGAVVTRGGLRRVSFRDPYVGCVAEILEDGPAAPWSIPGDAAMPAILYATSSVTDLAAAQRYYKALLGLEIEPVEQLHSADDEACWGLAGAVREGFLAHRGGVRLEIVAYQKPAGRAKPSDYRTSDQGIVNVALSADTAEEAHATFDRLAWEGLVSPHLGTGERMVTGYITDAERELEIVALPMEVRRLIGFEPTTPFIAAMD